MSEFAISYIVTTYNKLPYLRQVLGRLVATRQLNEEIVVADGGSTDGTLEYLSGLFASGQIQQFVSERDKGEAHGFNKCMFMACGEYIKLITDDDAFCYPAIRTAMAFMCAHPDVDVMMGYNAAIWLEDLTVMQVKEEAAKDYKRWYETHKPFQMIGLPLLIRRSSLALTGLLNSGVVMVDLDFIYRVSSMKVNLAWSNLILSSHVSNPNGNFNRMNQRSRDEEYNRIVAFYADLERHGIKDVVINLVETIKKQLRPAKRAFFERFNLPQYQNPELFPTGYVSVPGESPQDAVYRICDEFMASHNTQRPASFLFRTAALEKVMKP